MTGHKTSNNNRIDIDIRKVKFMEWKGSAVCPGSCGELVQGTWDGVNFLVPCPINLYSEVSVVLRPNSELVCLSGHNKALEAVRRTLAYIGKQELGGVLKVKTSIPWGKGMASSTADIGASIGATAAALGIALRAQEIAELAIPIEPTDATIFPGITLFDHVRGRWRLPLGSGPEAEILVVDLGGEVDTVEFNNRPELPELNRINEFQTRQAFHLVRRGIQEKNLTLLGRGCTLSAEANQVILPKDLLADIKYWNLKRGGFGVIAAHSGTVVGLLYAPGRDMANEGAELRTSFQEISDCRGVKLIKGGVKAVKTNASSRREPQGCQGTLRESGFLRF